MRKEGKKGRKTRVVMERKEGKRFEKKKERKEDGGRKNRDGGAEDGGNQKVGSSVSFCLASILVHVTWVSV